MLDSCHSLPPALRLLKTKVSFHLAALVTVSSGAHAPEEGIIDVVSALARDLSKDVREPPTGHPHSTNVQ